MASEEWEDTYSIPSFVTDGGSGTWELASSYHGQAAAREPTVPPPYTHMPWFRTIVNEEVKATALVDCGLHQTCNLRRVNTRISGRPSAYRHAAPPPPTSSVLRMLHTMGSTECFTPSAELICLAASLSRCSSLDAMTTRQDKRASSEAMARPMPVAPPVTIATRPSNKSGRNIDRTERSAIVTGPRADVGAALLREIRGTSWQIMNVIVLCMPSMFSPAICALDLPRGAATFTHRPH